jgi:tetratricopeptide (TPR) repeat protein
MRITLLLSAAAAAALLCASAATAQRADDHIGHSGAPAPGVLPAMPAIYGGQADKPGAPVFEGLGTHSHKISTSSPQAQAFFDQGVKLLFGFNHAEAIRSFREAARIDPKCAMCWWGVAFALGPNINLAMGEDAVAPAWAALARAQALAPGASPAERAWIEALATRYTDDPKADRKPLDAAFARAMTGLAERYPNDLDAATFAAEAMMDTQPWDYWEADGRTPKGNGARIISTLEQIMRRDPNHPGALHLYIHAVEASTTPERAEAAADRLLLLMPGAGHIVHMPSHIYYRVGRYADSARVNEQAATADEAYIASCRAQGFYPAGYYGHNIHFLWTSAEMQGRSEVALTAARRLVKAVDAVEFAKGVSLAELFVFTPVVTLVRFGRWNEVLAEPAPPEELILDHAVWRYARAFALANTGDRAGALAERDRLAAMTSADYAKYAAFNIPAPTMVSLALALTDGEIARQSGDLPAAVSHFRRAADLEQLLPYTEPPYWHQPVSHLLGAALLQAGDAPAAERVYRDSLVHYRRDPWALAGLARALEAKGEPDAAKKAWAEQRAAATGADVSFDGSRF